MGKRTQALLVLVVLVACERPLPPAGHQESRRHPSQYTDVTRIVVPASPQELESHSPTKASLRQSDTGLALAAPETSITAAPERFTNSSTATFSFATDTGTAYSYRLDGGTWSEWSGTASVDLSPVTDGAHLFEVKAQDASSAEDLTPATHAWRYIASPESIDLAAGGAPDFWAYGEQRFDFAGASVAAGDVNGDGYDDLIVGAPNAEGYGGAPSVTGRVYVLFGKSSFSGGRDLASGADIVFHGAEFDDQLGTAVAAGNVDDDGCADLILASPSSDKVRTDGGAISVIFGRGTGCNVTTAWPADWDLGNPPASDYVTIFGAEANDVAGLAVATGDVNGDAHDDILIGAPAASPQGRTRAGAAFLVFGRTHAEWALLGDLSDPAPSELPGVLDLALTARSYQVLGAEDEDALDCATISDVTGDGSGEIVLLAARADGPANGRPDAGEAYLIGGDPSLAAGTAVDLASPPAGVSIVFGVTGENLSSVGAGGNFNGDTGGVGQALNDLVLGSTNAASGQGAVYVVYGSESLPATIDLEAPHWDLRLRSGISQEQLGATALLADIDGDDYADLAMGAWTSSNAGKLLVLGGAAFAGGSDRIDFDLSTVSVQQSVLARSTGSLFGFSLAAGNVGWDSADELVVGAVFSSGGSGIPAGRARDYCGEAYLFRGDTGSGSGGSTAGPPAQLALYGEGILGPDACGAFSVVARDSVGLDATVSASTVVDLSVSGSGGPYSLYSDSTCSTSTTSVTIASGESSAPVYFRSSATEEVVVRAQNATLGISDWAVEIRDRTDGQLDATFNGSGTATLEVVSGGSPSTRNESLRALHVTSSGQLVAAGHTYTIGDEANDFLIVKYRYDGTLDTEFAGGQGFAELDILGYSDYPNGIAVQQTGHLLVAGKAKYGVGTENVIAVARYSSDGVLDTSFGSSGIVTTDLCALVSGGSKGLHHVPDIVVLPDNRFIVGGHSDLSVFGVDHFIVRYQADGTRDTTFGTDGYIVNDIGSGEDYVWAVAVQSDGKVLLGGAWHNGTDEEAALTRYLADGSGVDTSFGSTGTVTFNFGNPGDDGIRALYVLDDGRILAGGCGASAYNRNYCDYAMAMFNSDGSFDTSFGTNGKTIIGDEDYTENVVQEVLIQSDGKVVLVGSDTRSNGRFDVFRYLADGQTPDSTFGTLGKVAVAVGGSNDEALAAALDWQGNIVIAGSAYNGSNDDLALARVSGGFWDRFDPYFGTHNGVAGFDYAGNYNYSKDIVATPDGKTVLIGYDELTDSTASDLLLLGLDGSGAVDTTFGASGWGISAFHTFDEGLAGARQSDGLIVVAGHSSDTAEVARFAADGSVDTTFGSSGFTLGSTGRYQAVAIDDSGAITACGYGSSSSSWIIGRFDATGAPDASFDGDGMKVLDMAAPGDEERCLDVAVQSDGAIVAVGYVVNTAPLSDLTVVRLQPDGTLDTSFDSDGVVTTAIGTGDSLAQSVIVQPDGNIVVGGQSQHNSYERVPTILRYLSDGTLDSGFGDAGYTVLHQAIEENTTQNASGGVDAGFSDIVLQRDRKIVGVGYALGGGSPDWTLLLMRFNSDGSPDVDFYPQGYCARPIDDALLYVTSATAVAEAHDGRLVGALSCFADSTATDPDFGAVRFRP